MNVGIIGCGLIGRKRAQALGPDHKLVVVADVDLQRAEALAAQHSGCAHSREWSAVVESHEVELVIVATTNDKLTEAAMAAVARHKPVLLEKPAARNARELEPLIDLAARNNVLVKAGFNHRFHPALLKAREIWDTGEPGELMYIRGRYGHGGRLGYNKEWRADRQIAGGGELLDQGAHLIDLARWFAGEISSVEGHTATYFWDMPVEDNGFMLLKTQHGKTAWLHVSCTEWKNLFSFEIFGRNAKLQIDGLGGSYGTERLTYYKMLPQMGPPETTAWEYPGADKSWEAELSYFVECVQQRREPEGNLHDAMAALKIIGSLYDKQAAHDEGLKE